MTVLETMIYNYNKIAHRITGFHDAIILVFENIFAQDLSDYDEHLLIPEGFKDIVRASKAKLENPLKELVKIYHGLPSNDKALVKEALKVNNDIDCLYNKEKFPIKYSALHKTIQKPLKIFFTDLWECYPIVKAVNTTYGSKLEHYETIVDQGDIKVLICPFCGIENFKKKGTKKREAYDHFLAKSDYPFISMNFDLLFPTCHTCNSDEKKDKDTLYNKDGTRRKMYDPYDPQISQNPLEINIVRNESYNKKSLSTILSNIDWSLNFYRTGNTQEELTTWLDVYGIDKRYETEIKALERCWLSIILDDFKRSSKLGEPFNDFVKEELKKANKKIKFTAGGIIIFHYYRYLLTQDNIEERLKVACNMN
ncbi:MAG: hypothetical protein AAFX55_18180 [Bacteroidota bacterium]